VQKLGIGTRATGTAAMLTGAPTRGWLADWPAAVGRTVALLRLRTFGSGLFRMALAFSILVAAALFVVVVVPPVLGLKTMVVTSGSMSPEVLVGDAVLVRPVSWQSVRVGDVIVFKRIDGVGMTTHRVLATRGIQGKTYFQTKGDANSTPDANLTPGEAIFGKVAFTLPKGGYLVHFARGPLGIFFITVLPLFVILKRQMQWLLQPTKAKPAAARVEAFPEARRHEAGETA